MNDFHLWNLARDAEGMEERVSEIERRRCILLSAHPTPLIRYRL